MLAISLLRAADNIKYHASSTIGKLQDVSAALDAQSKGHFEKLAHHSRSTEIIGSELKEMSADLAQTREILATVQRVPKTSKIGETTKLDFVSQYLKMLLGHLCDVRDNHEKNPVDCRKKSPSGSERILAALEDIDWELGDTLDNCDLIELKVEPGTSIRDESLSGNIKSSASSRLPRRNITVRVAKSSNTASSSACRARGRRKSCSSARCKSRCMPIECQQ